jgi:hypothetical protein
VITFAEERFVDAWPELEVLVKAHWEETMRPFTDEICMPDVKRYEEFNKTGFYRLYIARKDGKMVGDMGIYLTVSMHTGKKIAQEDTWFMLPEARSGRVALRFVEFVEGELKKHGITSVNTTTPSDAGSRRLLEYMDYKHIANCYRKEF